MRAGFLAVSLLLAGASARAEIAILSNGTTLKIVSRQTEAERYLLTLKDGGEVGIPTSQVRGFVPDEVLDEIGPAATGGNVQDLVIAVARKYGVDPDLVLAVVAVESDFRPEAVSPKGAQGLMQLMPATARQMGVEDPFDPTQNLDGGARHLGSLIERYGGDLALALAAYNAGAAAVDRHRGVPPYRETRDYVARVLRRYGSKR